MINFRKTRQAATIMALAALASTTVFTASADAIQGPAGFTCGQTVTRSTVLAGDIGPCTGDGLIVGVDGITVNLNGHRLSGSPGPNNNVGIRLQKRSRVAIKNGTVASFGAGVAIMGGSHNIVSNITSRDNVGLINGSGDFGDGIAIVNSRDNLLSKNTVRHNGPFDGIGVFGAPSTGNSIFGNLVELNNIARFSGPVQLFLNLDDGINLGAGVGAGSHTRIIGNTVRRNGLNGIDACSIRGNPCLTTDDVIGNNLVESNGFGDPLHDDPFDTGDGIHVVGLLPLSSDPPFPPTRELVIGNIVLDNAGDGINVGSSDNEILFNRALGNGTIPDFYFDLQDVSLNFDCDHNVWIGNTFSTVDPPCAGANGHQVPSGSASPKTAAKAAATGPASLSVGRHFPSI